MGAEEIVPEKPVKEQIRDQKRAVDRSKRNLQREQKKLEREKKKMLGEIKKMAAKGQTTGAKMLARDIVRSTNQIKKLDQFVGQLTAVSMRISSCCSSSTMFASISSITSPIISEIISNLKSSLAMILAICCIFLGSNLLLTKVIAFAALDMASPNSFKVEQEEIRIDTAVNCPTN